jgi:acyl-coenzyme A thioesterase PaaI-like protein
MNAEAIQDYYPEEGSQCYGCGRLNPHGLHIKSYWQDQMCICTFRPQPYHTAMPGYVYGGLIASLIDCHATGTAAAAAYRAENRTMDTLPYLRFVTGSLQVKYLRPTPIDTVLKLQARVLEIKGRKVIVHVDLYAEDQHCAEGEVVAIQAPDHLMHRKGASGIDAAIGKR